MPSAGEVTLLIAAVRQGEQGALERLTPLVYEELRAVARRQLKGRRVGLTLDTTSLVNEAYVKLVDAKSSDWQDRQHFLSVAGVVMRNILVDAARKRTAEKRGGGEAPVTLDELRLAVNAPGVEGRAVEILAVDAALTSLAKLNERLSRLVELLYFAGLTEEEAAAVLGISDRTVRRDWRKARAFLFQALGQPGAAPSPLRPC